VNQDGTVNSAQHPAPSGSIVSVFATGLGPIRPAQEDGIVIGLPLPENSLAATAFINTRTPFGGQIRIPLEVQYAGPAPFQVAGFSQVNVRLPTGPGSVLLSTELTLQVADVTEDFNIYVGSNP
jgi:uncharacterized protein (TIGR03437 family)